ncbi:hypothetical protein [Halorubrum sp. 2020YC2]|uniref:hypothetical protein n=1 Tax=Halorubrum sp. 2020YC2 TaxID=2836432 RepID=UPI001BE4F281|nr:hypothetical protein [Halorubrum sp. 2020YC2]QWC19044.1 hypothetical protein KI388_13130 [Halorubrum sp. 2020YC2]
MSTARGAVVREGFADATVTPEDLSAGRVRSASGLLAAALTGNEVELADRRARSSPRRRAVRAPVLAATDGDAWSLV